MAQHCMIKFCLCFTVDYPAAETTGTSFHMTKIPPLLQLYTNCFQPLTKFGKVAKIAGEAKQGGGVLQNSLFYPPQSTEHLETLQ